MKSRSFWSGLVAGVCGATLLGLWISTQLDEVVYEKDRSSNLSQLASDIPKVALKPLTFEKVLALMKFRDEEHALESARLLLDRIEAGFLANTWQQRCQSELHPSLCAISNEYFSSFSERRGEIKKKPKKSTLPYSSVHMASLQRDPLISLLSRNDRPKFQILKSLARTALDSKECPKNFSLALARLFESHLEQPEAWVIMDRLDSHGLACLEPQVQGAEYIYLRVALLKIARNYHTQAYELLKKAALSTEKRETHRTFYWLSRTAKVLGLERESRLHQQVLTELHPLAWQSIKTYTDQNQDPMQLFSSKGTHNDRQLSGDPVLDRRLLWLRLALEVPNREYAKKRYAEFVVRSFDSKTPPSIFQHWARVFDHYGMHRLQILTLSRMQQLQSLAISTETIRIMFPKPYADEIKAQSINVDAAILFGLARQESSFDTRARSGANALGLLQILPTTAREIEKKTKPEDLYIPEINIRIGAKYLERLTRHFDGSIERALASYNAGIGRVQEWDRRFSFAKDTQLYIDLIPFRETREYVSSILRNAYWYHRLFPEFTLKTNDGIWSSHMLKDQLDTLSEEDLKTAPQ